MASYWIIGQGGIGRALSDALRTQGEQVLTVSRHAGADISCDVSDEAAVNALVDKTPLPDRVIIACGMLHQDKHTPEKSIKQVEAAWLQENLKANVYPTMHLAKALSAKISNNKAIGVLAFSARVGSISDNRLGGWHSYRMSKAALNMLIKNIAIEWRIKSPKSFITGYHPGTVDTALSKPFQTHVPEGKLFTPQQAASYCLDVLNGLSEQDSGKVVDWHGDIIEP